MRTQGVARSRPRWRVGLLVCAAAALVAAGCADGEPAEPGEDAAMTPTPPTGDDPEPTDGTEPDRTAEPDPTGSPADPTAEEPPGLITEADDGEDVTLGTGEEVPLRLDSAWLWEDPVVAGDAVSLTQVDYFQDPGFQEWIVVGEQSGRAELTIHGEPNCGDEAACPPHDVSFTFEVEG